MTLHSLEPEALRRAAMDAAPPQPHQADQTSQSLFAEFGTATSNQAKSVYNAVAQIADGVGLDLPAAKLQTQSAATLMSPRWWMQQGGSLAVTLPLVLLTHKGISALSAPLAASAAGAAEVSSEKALTMSAEKLSMARLTATGAVYEGVFKPSDDKSLLWGRSKQAAEGGFSFLAMGVTASKIGSSMALGVAEGEVPSSFSTRLVRAALPGLGGGAAMGMTHEQTSSLLDTGSLAGFGKTLNAGVRGSIMGLAMSPLGMLPLGRAQAAVARETEPVSVSRDTAGAVRSDGSVSVSGQGDGTAAVLAKGDGVAQAAGQRSAGEVVTVRPAENVETTGTRATAMTTNPADNVLNGLVRDTNLNPRMQDDLLSRADRDIDAGLKLARSGEHQQAFDQLNNALKAIVRVRGPEHPSLAGVLGDMARSDMFLGNNARSIESLQSALRINKSSFGDGSPQVADNYDQLSAIYQRSGNYGQAAQALDNSISAGRIAAEGGRLTGPAQQHFEANLRDRLGQVARLYEKGGDATRAAQVRGSIPPPLQHDPTPHQ